MPVLSKMVIPIAKSCINYVTEWVTNLAIGDAAPVELWTPPTAGPLQLWTPPSAPSSYIETKQAAPKSRSSFFTKIDLIQAIKNQDPAWTRIIRISKRRHTLRKLQNADADVENIIPTSPKAHDEARRHQKKTQHHKKPKVIPSSPETSMEITTLPRSRTERRRLAREIRRKLKKELRNANTSKPYVFDADGTPMNRSQRRRAEREARKLGKKHPKIIKAPVDTPSTKPIPSKLFLTMEAVKTGISSAVVTVVNAISSAHATAANGLSRVWTFCKETLSWMSSIPRRFQAGAGLDMVSNSDEKRKFPTTSTPKDIAKKDTVEKVPPGSFSQLPVDSGLTTLDSPVTTEPQAAKVPDSHHEQNATDHHGDTLTDAKQSSGNDASTNTTLALTLRQPTAQKTPTRDHASQQTDGNIKPTLEAFTNTICQQAGNKPSEKMSVEFHTLTKLEKVDAKVNTDSTENLTAEFRTQTTLHQINVAVETNPSRKNTPEFSTRTETPATPPPPPQHTPLKSATTANPVATPTAAPTVRFALPETNVPHPTKATDELPKSTTDQVIQQPQRRLSNYTFTGQIVKNVKAMVTGWSCKSTGKEVILKELFEQEDAFDTDFEVQNLRDLKGLIWVTEIIDSFWQPGVEDSSTASRMILMERCSMDLQDFVEGGKTSTTELKFIAFEMALGLEAIHDAGFIHGDIKPGNVLVNATSKRELVSIKISDFGTSSKSKSEEGVCGTVGYIPLEVLRDEVMTPMMDWFGMGVTLFHISSPGLLPFNGKDIRAQKKSMKEHIRTGKTMNCWELDNSITGSHGRYDLDFMYDLIELDVEKRVGSKEDVSRHPHFNNVPDCWRRNIFDETNAANIDYPQLKRNDKYGKNALELSAQATDEFPEEPEACKEPTVEEPTIEEPTVAEENARRQPILEEDEERKPYLDLSAYKFDGMIAKTSKAVVSGWTFRSTDEKVVMKQLKYPNKDYEPTPENEVNVLRHFQKIPWVAKIYTACTQPGPEPALDSVVIIQERCSMSLAELCDRRSLTEREIKFIAFACAHGIESIHRTNFIHRNICPDNILVNVTPDLKLLSIKIAGCNGAIEADEDEEAVGQVGTPGFKAPEMLEDALAAFATDWFSLGAVLFFISTDGKLPYGDGELMNPVDRMRNSDVETWIPTVCLGEDFEDLMLGVSRAYLLKVQGFMILIQCFFNKNSSCSLAKTDSAMAAQRKSLDAFFRNVPAHWSKNLFDDKEDEENVFFPELTQREGYDLSSAVFAEMMHVPKAAEPDDFWE
ncbi:hypothetical protein HDU97_005914 [Phlyctochytrium planicorne]|nr:hypothetical protein HDU97_005914 [Phlyctochytrium planicorne]